MKNDLFEKAKQVVAENNDFDSWEDLASTLRRQSDFPDSYFQEVAEWMCNKSVIKDRCQILESGYVQRSIYHKRGINKLPLPFPQQPDGL